jgi:uncharacterized protein
MPVAITPLYAALVAFLVIGLTVGVIRNRQRAQVSLGTGGDTALERAIRAHGNCLEYAPLALLLILMVELVGYAPPVVHGLGSALVVGRVLHAWGLVMRGGRSFGRVGGVVLTVAVLTIAASLCLASFVTARS